jgi:hypothetical protein
MACGSGRTWWSWGPGLGSDALSGVEGSSCVLEELRQMALAWKIGVQKVYMDLGGVLEERGPKLHGVNDT